ncbi:MAG: DUF6088 family protein [Saprospiraceae bacterium]
MPKSIEVQVLDRIKRNPRGTLFFVDSFVAISNAKAVNKALERLVNLSLIGEISMLAIQALRTGKRSVQQLHKH